jgi:hypothetical protein
MWTGFCLGAIMTTVKELQRDEDKKEAFLLDVLEAAKALDKAELDMAGFVKNFRRLSSNVAEVLGMELWHSEDHGDKEVWFWRRSDKPTNRDNESIHYGNRTSAIHALIDGVIEWQ